jgi:uncharacterized pyridoxamine 5'-phosphate oxidase family protein
MKNASYCFKQIGNDEDIDLCQCVEKIRLLVNVTCQRQFQMLSRFPLVGLGVLTTGEF